MWFAAQCKQWRKLWHMKDAYNINALASVERGKNVKSLCETNVLEATDIQSETGE